MKEYKSVCPYDCPDACGLILTVDDNKVTKIRGNKEHLSHGAHYVLRWLIMSVLFIRLNV